MKIKIKFTNLRQSYVLDGYRPDWASDRKRDWNGAKLEITSPSQVFFMDTVEAYIHPLAPEYWLNVFVGDKLYCFEGPRCTGAAEVVEIER